MLYIKLISNVSIPLIVFFIYNILIILVCEYFRYKRINKK
jgi:hypothetical protein